MRLRPHSADSTMLRLRPTGSSVGIAPVDYDPVVLLKPFGPRLAADALPSEDSSLAAPGQPIRVPAFAVVPHQPLHPFPSSSAGEALPPPLDISPGPRAEWDFNPPDTSAVRHTVRTHPPPSRLRPTSRGCRLYGLPCSGDFSPGRGGFLQLLSMSLSPVLSLPPRQGEQPHRSVFGWSFCLRPSDAGSALGDIHFRGHNAFTFVTAPWLLTSPGEVLSIGFEGSVSISSAIQTTGL